MEIDIGIEWIRAAKWCEVTGTSMESVEGYIRNHDWAAEKEYKRTGPRTLWINARAANKWIANQKHVETVPFPKASKFAQASAKVQ